MKVKNKNKSRNSYFAWERKQSTKVLPMNITAHTFWKQGGLLSLICVLAGVYCGNQSHWSLFFTFFQIWESHDEQPLSRSFRTLRLCQAKPTKKLWAWLEEAVHVLGFNQGVSMAKMTTSCRRHWRTWMLEDASAKISPLDHRLLIVGLWAVYIASGFRNYCYGILGNLAWPTMEHNQITEKLGGWSKRKCGCHPLFAVERVIRSLWTYLCHGCQCFHKSENTKTTSVNIFLY